MDESSSHAKSAGKEERTMKKNGKLLAALIAAAFALVLALPAGFAFNAEVMTAPEGYNEHDYLKGLAVLETENGDGITNGQIRTLTAKRNSIGISLGTKPRKVGGLLASNCRQGTFSES